MPQGLLPSTHGSGTGEPRCILNPACLLSPWPGEKPSWSSSASASFKQKTPPLTFFWSWLALPRSPRTGSPLTYALLQVFPTLRLTSTAAPGQFNPFGPSLPPLFPALAPHWVTPELRGSRGLGSPYSEPLALSTSCPSPPPLHLGVWGVISVAMILDCPSLGYPGLGHPILSTSAGKRPSLRPERLP